MRRGARLAPLSFLTDESDRQTQSQRRPRKREAKSLVLPQTEQHVTARTSRTPRIKARAWRPQCCWDLRRLRLPLRSRSDALYAAKGVLLTVAAFASLMLSSQFLFPSPRTPLSSRGERRRSLEESVLSAYAVYSVVFHARLAATEVSSIHFAPRLSVNEQSIANQRDLGGLDIKFLETVALRLQRREIYHDFSQDRRYGDLMNDVEDEEYVESYYAFDDDDKRNPLVEWDDPDIHKEKRCRRTSWHRDLPIACNNMHEYDFPQSVLDGNTKYLGYVRCTGRRPLLELLFSPYSLIQMWNYKFKEPVPTARYIFPTCPVRLSYTKPTTGEPSTATMILSSCAWTPLSTKSCHGVRAS